MRFDAVDFVPWDEPLPFGLLTPCVAVDPLPLELLPPCMVVDPPYLVISLSLPALTTPIRLLINGY